MNVRFEQLVWEKEVGAAAAELIRAGVAPWVARLRAADVVRTKRQDAGPPDDEGE